MFEEQEFSPRSPASPTNIVSGIPIEVYFSPHDEASKGIAGAIKSAQNSIYFLAFTFTDDDFGALFQERIKAGVKVIGVFEKRGSDTTASEFKPLFCAGAEVRTDGSKYSLHDKVIIVDETIVITGSANYSLNAMENNNENTIIIYDPVLASVYKQEFDRQWAIAQTPTDITCP
jgi:phosphatidylserine/phosphatidylglycerophosphate/cardiolipin synthase-like enzyme